MAFKKKLVTNIQILSTLKLSDVASNGMFWRKGIDLKWRSVPGICALKFHTEVVTFYKTISKVKVQLSL
jgi:hypothetical protein